MKKNKNNEKTIVVVDDDESILSALKIVLMEFGFNVNAVSDSKRAINEIRISKPHLIFLDLIMPNLDGEDILMLLKSEMELSTIPVILLSASNTLEEVAIRHKTAGFLKKPFDIDYLHKLITSKIAA